MPPEEPRGARSDALAELAAEAARFAATGQESPPKRSPANASLPLASTRRRRTPRNPGSAVPEATGGREVRIAGYVPNAVAPERGNTRPLVPVDGRLHLRAAPATIEALDRVVGELRRADPIGLRDLERATLVRIGAAVILADVAANGAKGLVGEAVRAALDPAQRHLDVPMPDPARWLRSEPGGGERAPTP